MNTPHEYAPACAPSGPPGELYVPEAHLNQIAVIDTACNQVIHHIPVNDIPVMPLGSRPAVLVATPDGSKIYSDNFGLIPPTISVFQRSTGELKSIILSSVPLGIFMSTDGREIYIPEGNYSIEVVSTETDTIIRRLTLPDVPVGSICGRDGCLYIGYANGDIGVHDVSNGNLLRPLLATGVKLPAWYSFSADDHKLYVVGASAICVIDLRSWLVLTHVPTGSTPHPKSGDPWAFTSTLSPDGRKLYVTLLGDNGVLIIDTEFNHVIGRIDTAGSPTGVTFSDDGSRGYISDLGPSLSFLKTPVGGSVVATAWIGFGIMGSGQILVFDPASDQFIGDPIPTTPGPGISIWLPPL
ncbi:YncE family protein [Pseudomonas chlororaphis]|uniref:YncE family protein n=1 Tax=Pseudomonas chlororaphis TaxID=587753 RepID=UPI000F54E7AB|nr:YncE family protein [Pseudomonas chlororaphis]AZD48530.1 hypothetical protein C4K20_3115 [Pseudomonas chlororaphis subsp. aurantiaca]QQX57572.1 hypothetical protein JHW28_23830 [Pseudomonas chlororaphis subsp. aurantiaca]